MFSRVLFVKPAPPKIPQAPSNMPVEHLPGTAAITTGYAQALLNSSHATTPFAAATPKSPGVSAATSTNASASAAALYMSKTVVLPLGWERKTTSNGKVYYVDHNTQTNHWTLPSSAAADRSSSKRGLSSGQIV
jgi:hypothetical protein